MAITLVESERSRNTVIGDQTEIDYVWILRGDDDENNLQAALGSGTPSTITTTQGTLRRTSRRIEHLAPLIYEGTVHYELPQLNSYSFKTGGGTQHITQSKETVNSYGTSPPDTKGAIGVTKDSVDGVDIVVPVFQWTEVIHFDPSEVDAIYRAKCYHLTGKTNEAIFRGFAIGEVLFMGVTGNQRGIDDFEATFEFAASPNATGLSAGDIGSITKGGWSYLWVMHEDAVSNNVLVKVPKAVYVERVYDSGDFADLNIGVT